MSDQIFLVSPHPPNVILNTYLVSKQYMYIYYTNLYCFNS